MNIKQFSNEQLSEEFISRLIDELNLLKMERHEAECVIYAWLLKTKLALISETSCSLSEQAVSMIDGEISKAGEGRFISVAFIRRYRESTGCHLPAECSWFLDHLEGAAKSAFSRGEKTI